MNRKKNDETTHQIEKNDKKRINADIQQNDDNIGQRLQPKPIIL